MGEDTIRRLRPSADWTFCSYSRTGLNLGIILVPFALQGTSGLSQRIISKDMELQSRFASTFLEGSRSEGFKLEHDLYLHLIDLFRQLQELYHATTRLEM